MVATLAPVAKQWIRPRIFRVTGANQNAQKLLFTDLINTNTGYCQRRDSTRKVPPPLTPPPPHPRPQQPPPLNTATDRLTCNNRAPTCNGTHWSTHPLFTFHLSIYFWCSFILYGTIIISPIWNGKEVFSFYSFLLLAENFPHNLNFRSEKAIPPVKKNSSNSYL